MLQYNEDTHLLDKELDNIKKVDDNSTFYALQHLRQHVLEKSIVQYILFPSNKDIVLDTLQEVYVVPVREIYNRIEFTSATTFAAETSSKRKTTSDDQINSNLFHKKSRLQENIKVCTKPSSELTIPNIPDKLITVHPLEVIG